MAEQLLTLEQVAEYLNVDKFTVYRLLADKDLPAFKVGGKAIAGYGSFKNHCSYFPHSGSVLPTLADQLGDYEWTKGTLHFPIDSPLPKALVVNLVTRRLEQLGISPDGSTEP